jgi:inhibitor of KinA
MLIRPLTDTAISVSFGDDICPGLYGKVQAVFKKLTSNPFPGMVECVPSYTSVTVFYDPYYVVKKHGKNTNVYEFVYTYLSLIAEKAEPLLPKKEEIISVPVCYGGKYGPDLKDVAIHNGLSEEEVIRLHSESLYVIYMLGFAPGFPYLGGMPKEIATPRRQSPRLRVPSGAVGIGGSQTGIYPLKTPGGWNIIGRTPVSLFQPEKNPPSLLQAGTYLRFVPITEKEFCNWKECDR